MTLVPWSPYKALRNFEREMGHLFGDASGYAGGEWFPAAEIAEKKNFYEISLELPGVEKEDVRIKLDDNVLTIEGEKKAERESEEKDYRVCECSYGTFTRSFTLPNTADRDKIKAKYNNGILKLSIPKTEQAKPKEIEIN
ncbi:Hsp20/alpha crystallin family protein [bacterium]|nr:Hsp20/alpha crystallin family protein [bacterium]